MPGSCNRYDAPLIEIEHHGNRLIGMPAIGGKGTKVRLSSS
jgi:hypothetical protein